MSQNDNLKQVMTKFCDIMIPNHDNKQSYVNVKGKAKALGIDRRTYYNWINNEAFPRLPDFVRRLNKKGYELQIVPIYRDM